MYVSVSQQSAVSVTCDQTNLNLWGIKFHLFVAFLITFFYIRNELQRHTIYRILYTHYFMKLPACRRLLFPLLLLAFPRVTKEIGEVCTRAIS